MTGQSHLSLARMRFHSDVLSSVMRVTANGVPNNADTNNRTSVAIATSVLRQIGSAPTGKLAGQSLGTGFEQACERFLNATFPVLDHLRPGPWSIDRTGPRKQKGVTGIAQFDQYEHLVAIQRAAKSDSNLAAAIGTDYIIEPDVMVYRAPFDDAAINRSRMVVDEASARHTSMRRLNQAKPILHASISCKWTIRSDRSQNARSEGLNLIRNRKGRVPHAVVVTAEPLPSRIASVALGTGDLDCVYHFALTELEAAVADLGYDDAAEMLAIMVEGKRLRDISDLPLDLIA